MTIQYVTPENELLKKHIAYYFLFNPEKEFISKEFFQYPNANHLVTIFTNFSSTFENNQYTIQEISESKLTIDITGRFTRAYICKVQGHIRGISIVFKPLGINFFCDTPFCDIVPHVHNYFTYWNDRANDFETALAQTSITEIGQQLDATLLSLYRPFRHKMILDTLELIHGNYTDFTVDEISQTLGVNRKTLLRQFKKHLGVSITDYRRILRFREAIRDSRDETLTQRAYQAHFSDQSHFIRDFQKMTGETPKKVLRESELVKNTPFFIKMQ